MTENKNENERIEKARIFINKTKIITKYEYTSIFSEIDDKDESDFEEGLVIIHITPSKYKDSEKVLDICLERIIELQKEMESFRYDREEYLPKTSMGKKSP